MDYFVTETITNDSHIEEVYAKGVAQILLSKEPLPVNTYINLRGAANNKLTALLRHVGDNNYVLRQNSTSVGSGISPKGLNQGAFCDVLTNPTIPLNVCFGAAGTGKTTLAMAYALDRIIAVKGQQASQRLILSKPAVTVGRGKAFGPVPGDINEKYAPYLESFIISMKKILGPRGEHYVEMARKNGAIEFMPTELMRGCTFDNAIVVVDEFQNLSWHELNTLISRIGENSKLILLGDPSQVDVQFGKGEYSGLEVMLSAPPFKNSALTSVSQLKTVYRSPICALATDINDYYRTSILKVPTTILTP